jgi:hypothetical protein
MSETPSPYPGPEIEHSPKSDEARSHEQDAQDPEQKDLEEKEEELNPEQEAKQQEAFLIGAATSELFKVFHGQIDSREGTNNALGTMYNLCKLIAKRDPEMGAMLVAGLESYQIDKRDQHISEILRHDLGLPERDL